MGIGAARRLGIGAAAAALVALLALASATAAAQEPGGLAVPTATPTVEGYLLPWPAGYAWENWYGWHGTGYGLGYTGMDFAPPLDAPQEAYVVLAAASGTLTEMCGPADGDYQQSTLRIDHRDGLFTIYMHLDGASVPRDLLGTVVQRGQFLGTLYTGGATGGVRACLDGSCAFSSPCGYGTTIHLHFQFADATTPVDGYVPDGIAYSAYGTGWLSSNAAVGYQVPTPAPTTAAPVLPVVIVSEARPAAPLGNAVALARPAAMTLRTAEDWAGEAPTPMLALAEAPLAPAASAATAAATQEVQVTPAATATAVAASTWPPVSLSAPVAVPTHLPAPIQPPATVDAAPIAPATPLPAPTQPAAVAYEWEGSIVVPMDGRYLLVVAGMGDAQLWLDGALILDATGGAADPTLRAGQHTLRVLCQPTSGYGSASFSYTYLGPATGS